MEPNPFDVAQGRKSIRLNGYDYSQAGGYFVTIVTQTKESFFGKVCGGEMILNDAGKMVDIEWKALQERFPNIELDVYQLMPNHFHGIILIHNPAPGLVPTLDAQATTRVAPTLGAVVGAFKSITTYEYIQGVEKLAWPVFTKRLWQRNYYEHIIRDQEDYERIAGYILANPANWNLDDENPNKP